MTEEKKKKRRACRIGRLDKPSTTTHRFTIAEALADPEKKIYRPIAKYFRSNVVWYTRITHGMKLEMDEAVNMAYLRLYENLRARADKTELISLAYIVACAYFHLLNEVRRTTHSGRDKGVASLNEMIDNYDGKECVADAATYDTDRTSYRELVALLERELEACPIWPQSKDMVRAIIFDGRSAVEIAREKGITRQAVHEPVYIFKNYLIRKYGGKAELWNLFMQGVGKE